MEKRKKRLWAAACWLAAFAAWTGIVCLVNLSPIGPEGSAVGLSGLNAAARDLIGVRMFLYALTDLLSVIPIGIAVGSAVEGLVQWIRRGRLGLVDRDLLALGGFYAAVMAAYLLFEVVEVNYRPILIRGRLEASYPSTTTVLSLCVLSTAAMRLCARVRRPALRWGCLIAMTGFAAFFVIGRVLSGVHWITDIVGGILLSGGLVWAYRAFSEPV